MFSLGSKLEHVNSRIKSTIAIKCAATVGKLYLLWPPVSWPCSWMVGLTAAHVVLRVEQLFVKLTSVYGWTQCSDVYSSVLISSDKHLKN